MSDAIKDAVLVGGKIDHAVGDDHVDRVVGQRDVLDLALEELDVLRPGFAFVLVGQGQHLVGHVDADGPARWPDPLRGEQDIDPAARAEIQHYLARVQLGQRRGIAAA